MEELRKGEEEEEERLVAHYQQLWKEANTTPSAEIIRFPLHLSAAPTARTYKRCQVLLTV